MRIGIMLRTYNDKGGIGVYTRNIVRELVLADTTNEYVLFFWNPESMGQFSDYPNVKERLVKRTHKAVWDQIAVPLACRDEKVDLLFHPKFTIPLLASCKVVMTVHGADWLIPEQAQYYSRLNVLYNRLMLPHYIRKCSAVLSVSQLTTDDFNRTLDLPPDKVHTVYFAPAPHFARVIDQNVLYRIKAKYRLPDGFILTLTRRDADSRKNFARLLAAYGRYHQQTSCPHALVVGGKDGDQLSRDYELDRTNFGRDVYFPGWIEQEDLPAVYTLADVYLYPSNLEAFPIPLTEAMACGTPIITSDANGLREIAGEAAAYVNPNDAGDIASTLAKVLDDASWRTRLSQMGLMRSSNFRWDNCVRETLKVFDDVYRSP